MVNNSQGGYRIIDLQEEGIFEKMAEIITEPKPLLIAGNTENGTTDFITASHEIQITRDGNDNVISYRVPTGAVNHSDIDGRGEKDWWQYFTYVTPSGNNFVREKVSEVFNRDAQFIELSFPSELITSVRATSNIVALYVSDESEYIHQLGTFNLIGNEVDVYTDIVITYEKKGHDYHVEGTITYNLDTLMYDISLHYSEVPFGYLSGKIDISLLSGLVKARRKSDELSYDYAVTYDLRNSTIFEQIGEPEYVELAIYDGSEFWGHEILEHPSIYQNRILTLGTHNYDTATVWNDTENKYQLIVSRCTDAEPLYADKKLYGDVKIGEHITVTDGVITPDIATKEQLGIVQVGDHIGVTDGVITPDITTKEQLGIVQVGDHIGVTDGVITPDIATKEQLGIVQVGDNIDVADGVVSVPVATSTTKGVVSVAEDSMINLYSGYISCGLLDIYGWMLEENTNYTIRHTFNSITLSNLEDSNKQCLCLSCETDDTKCRLIRYPNVIDDNCFIGGQFSDKTAEILVGSTYDPNVIGVTPLKNTNLLFITKCVTIDGTDYYIRVPVLCTFIWNLIYSPSTKTSKTILNGYCDFKVDANGKWDSTNFIPDIEVGASGTKVMTYDTSTSQVVPMMKAFSVSITMPDGITYSIPSYELYVQDGKAYIVSVTIDLNQANPTVTDTFATFTFTRVF